MSLPREEKQANFYSVRAVEQMRLNVGWKYALDLEWEDEGFHPPSLVVFRRCPLDGNTERVGLERPRPDCRTR